MTGGQGMNVAGTSREAISSSMITLHSDLLIYMHAQSRHVRLVCFRILISYVDPAFLRAYTIYWNDAVTQ